VHVEVEKLTTMDTSFQDRVISLGTGLAAIPERLLLAHARGEVLFICGAGISKSAPANLPDFRELVLDVYKALDASAYVVLKELKSDKDALTANLNNGQKAEAKRFMAGDYDVVLGMLERRHDGQTKGDSQVRRAVANRLREGKAGPALLHKVLMRLADRGGATTIVTTNFDLLLEAAGKRPKQSIQTYALGSIPRPTWHTEFSGVMHIHGALDPNPERMSELVLTDQDFGEFYLRRRVVPDFIYDAARLYHLVLVGYSANDPPMRYLLNAVAADGTRFDDIKDRFVFFGTESADPVALEDWKARGIVPINYDSKDNHQALLQSLEKWAKFSAVNGEQNAVDREIRRIVKLSRTEANEPDCDFFDHFIRRSNANERVRLSGLASDAGAELGWLNAIVAIGKEKTRLQKS
jgi:hypothetical protein